MQQRVLRTAYAAAKMPEAFLNTDKESRQAGFFVRIGIFSNYAQQPYDSEARILRMKLVSVTLVPHSSHF